MMDLRSRSILVTGSDGFIGSHLVETLVRKGCRVRAFVLYNAQGTWGWLDAVPAEIRDSIEVFAGDIRDSHGVRTALKGCDVVLHLAALIGIPYSYHSPDTYVDTNIKGTLNLLQAARDLGVEKFVHTSTSEVYGTARHVPIAEDHPLQAQSPYSATKIAADQMAIAFQHAFGTPVAILRPFNTYGPRQSARAVIPTIITQIAEGGARLRLGSLHPTRDFSYVEDTVSGFIAVAESERSAGETINIGSGFEISIGDTARLIAEVMGATIEVEEEDIRIRPKTSEVERLLVDYSKARELLGWHPSFRGLDGFRRGIERTVRWFMDPENRRSYRPWMYTI